MAGAERRIRSWLTSRAHRLTGCDVGNRRSRHAGHACRVWRLANVSVLSGVSAPTPFCAPPTDQTEGITPNSGGYRARCHGDRPRTVLGIRPDAQAPRASATPCLAAWGLGSRPRSRGPPAVHVMIPKYPYQRHDRTFPAQSTGRCTFPRICQTFLPSTITVHRLPVGFQHTYP